MKSPAANEGVSQRNRPSLLRAMAHPVVPQPNPPLLKSAGPKLLERRRARLRLLLAFVTAGPRETRLIFMSVRRLWRRPITPAARFAGIGFSDHGK